MAETQSKLPFTQPHSSSVTSQSLARPALRSIASSEAVQKWHAFSDLRRPKAKRFE